MVFVVTYDLREPNDAPQDYERVISHIKANFAWCHLQKSFWLVDSALNAAEIRESIRTTLHQNDLLLRTGSNAKPAPRRTRTESWNGQREALLRLRLRLDS